MEFLPRQFAGKVPFDSGAVAVDAALPSLNFSAQCRQGSDSAPSQALPTEQTHFDLRLIEPTAVLGRVMNGEALPQQAAQLFSVALRECFRASG